MATKSRSKPRTNNAKPFTILGDTLESAAESFEEATVNANESARRAARTTKRALATGVFKVFYGLSYGLVYSGVFITELLPEQSSVRRALSEGAESALRSREKARLAKKTKKAIPKSKEADLDADAEAEPSAKAKRKRPVSKVSARTRSTVKSRAEAFEADAAEAV